jgi:hypothetical protein
MQIQIEATDDVVVIDGTPCRRWHGTTAEGVECEVFTRMVQWPPNTPLPDGSPVKFAPRPPAISNLPYAVGEVSPLRIGNALT